jgi:hypothetical protein
MAERMSAVTIPWGFAEQNPMPKSGMEAVALGRHGGRLFPLLGVFAQQKLRKAKIRMDAPAWMPAVTNSWGLSDKFT